MPLEAIVRAGNSKLGVTIGKTALPAVQTCPSRTTFCEKSCYAVRLMAMYPSYDLMVQTHLQVLENDPEGYFAQVCDDIQTNGYQTVRINESGDLFSVAQIQGWIQTAQKKPTVRFFAYTRSWANPELLPSLEAFRALPNVQLFASIDESTTAIPPKAWRTAAIAPRGTVKAPTGAIVCPEALGNRVSCADCGFCFKANGSKTQNVLFPKH